MSSTRASAATLHRFDDVQGNLPCVFLRHDFVLLTCTLPTFWLDQIPFPKLDQVLHGSIEGAWALAQVCGAAAVERDGFQVGNRRVHLATHLNDSTRRGVWKVP